MSDDPIRTQETALTQEEIAELIALFGPEAAGGVCPRCGRCLRASSGTSASFAFSHAITSVRRTPRGLARN